jgi:hypothetical protein
MGAMVSTCTQGALHEPLLRVREHAERRLRLPERAMERHESLDEPWGRARRGEGLVLELAVVQSLREGAAACGDVAEHPNVERQLLVAPFHVLGEREQLEQHLGRRGRRGDRRLDGRDERLSRRRRQLAPARHEAHVEEPARERRVHLRDGGARSECGGG